jgi:hypothetical protein
VTWRTYQEGLNTTTGLCPIKSSGFYAAKHDPFVFFQDVSGNPPSKTNSYCGSHHKAYSAFATDLANGDVASYTFITPNLCNDMHGASGCPNSNTIQSGDTWLSTELPRIISYANANAGDAIYRHRPRRQNELHRDRQLQPQLDHQVGRGDLELVDVVDGVERERPLRPVPERSVPVT